MNFKDYSAEIAKKADVDEQTTRRVMRALFDDIKSKLNKGQNVPLPTVGRLINRILPGGGKRIILARPGQKIKPQVKGGPKAKAKPTRTVKKAALKPHPAARKRMAVQRKK